MMFAVAVLLCAAAAVAAGQDPVLVAAGSFASAGGRPASEVAAWNGAAWSGLGAGVDAAIVGTAVRAIQHAGGALYVGGDFSLFIARWDGTGAWATVGGGTDAPVRALAAYSNAVFAGGDFSAAGGVAGTAHIAQWNGQVWATVGGGLPADGTVHALAVTSRSGSSDVLVVAGSFSGVTGAAGARNIAVWDGAAWSTLGVGFNGVVDALCVWNGQLYAAGNFTAFADGVPTSRLARWAGAVGWKAVGGGLDGPVHALAVYGGALFVLGRFETAGGVPAARIAQWTGTEFLDVGGGLNAAALAGTTYGGALVVGGEFTNAGGLPVHFVVRWNGLGWSSVGTGVGGPVSALAVGTVVPPPDLSWQPWMYAAVIVPSVLFALGCAAAIAVTVVVVERRRKAIIRASEPEMNLLGVAGRNDGGNGVYAQDMDDGAQMQYGYDGTQRQRQWQQQQTGEGWEEPTLDVGAAGVGADDMDDGAEQGGTYDDTDDGNFDDGNFDDSNADGAGVSTPVTATVHDLL